MENIFPNTLSKEAKAKLTSQAEKIFGKKITELTRDNIAMLVQMDMAISMSNLTVSASATRPTSISYANNNYFASIQLDTGPMFKLAMEKLQSVPDDQLIDQYLEMKQTLYNMVEAKYEGTENFLRSLLEIAIEKDGCPKVGRFSKD